MKKLLLKGVIHYNQTMISLVFLSVLFSLLLVARCNEMEAEEDRNGNGGDAGLVSFNIRSSAVILVCSEDALRSTQKVRHLLGSDGISVKNVDNFWEAPRQWMSSKKANNFSIRVDEPSCRSSLDEYLENTGNHSSTVHFYPNGYFRHEMEIYAPDEYCIKSFSRSPHDSSLQSIGSSINIKLCPPTCGVGKQRACIKKCCPLDTIYRGDRGKPFCVSPPPGSSQFMPPLYHDYNRKVETFSESTGDGDVSNLPDDLSPKQLLPHFVINNPARFLHNCKDEADGVVVLPSSEMGASMLTQRSKAVFEDVDDYHSSAFRIRTDGAIMYKVLEYKCEIMKNPGNICVDGMRGALSEDVWTPFHNQEDEYIIFHCQTSEKDDSMNKYISLTYGPLLLVTSIFPLMTCVVYVLLWKKQTVHGWSIAATSGCLFLMYIFNGSAHIIGITLKKDALNTVYCRVLGIFIHFFMMSTFTWLTVMSCDLWLTFRSVTPMNPRLSGVSRYLKYSAFGWGIPAIIVLIGILMDFVIYSSEDCSYHAVPGYGQESCWIVENSLGEYIYYPAGFLLCVNIVLFTATCMKLMKYGRGPTIRTRKNDATGECFSRFTKLFCVMGISWIFEIVSWYVDGLGFVWYWYVLDVFNILRAVGVFVIYVCKKDIIMQLEDLHPSIRNCLRPFGSLFLRKCSEEFRTDTSVCTGIPGSPAAIPLKTANRESRELNIRVDTQTLDIPK